MTTKKVRIALTLVEVKVEAFKSDPTREKLEKAWEKIQSFNHEIGIELWDECCVIKKIWDEKKDLPETVEIHDISELNRHIGGENVR
ncbi:MAG: hypothetical protein VST70_06920 [Nitrospirota bacterium]|nr:hypothetical protein [Nitrospirota bacterium]